MSGEILVDFNSLPRATRERFVDSTSEAPSLAPVFADRHSTGGTIFWWGVLGLICAFVLVLAVVNDFGRLDGYSIAVQPAVLLPVYFFAVLLLVASGLGIAFELKRRASLPFQAGRYLFPLDFVDARTPELRIISLSELANFQAVHHHTNGAYSHTIFTFTFNNGRSEAFSIGDKSAAESQMESLQRARAMFGKALEQQDANAIHRIDLFFDVRLQGGFEKLKKGSVDVVREGPCVTVLPPLIERRWKVALAAGVVLGSGIWLARNVVSDQLTFAKARREGTSLAYRHYLRHGWLHASEAKELGSQVNFAECETQETEACWNEFISRWSESPRLEEARVERLPRAALKEASGTVSGVRDFRKRYPGSVVDEQARARIHTLFTEALAEFQKQASTDNPALVPFVGKLLAHLEATESSRVLVRFRREASESLKIADRILGQAMSEEGKPMAKASPYFDEAHTRPLEQNITQELGNAFKTIFPADILTLENGPALPEQRDASSETVPELGIVYTVAWSGSVYSAEKGGRRFVGIQFNFDAGMSVPKEKPLNFTLAVNPPERFSVQYTRYMDRLGSMMGEGESPGDGLVYNIMSLRAFDEMSAKLGRVFFRPDSEAFLAGGLGGEEEEGAPAPAAPPKKDSRRRKSTASSTPP